MADAEIAACPGMPELIAKAKTETPWFEHSIVRLTEKQKTSLRRHSRQESPAWYLGNTELHLLVPQIFWKCASDKLAALPKAGGSATKQ